MSQSVEVSGPDIESAIAQALAKLGVVRDQVQIEVLEEPTRRLLGLGVRPARIRVTVNDGVVLPSAASPSSAIAQEPVNAVSAGAMLPTVPVAAPSQTLPPEVEKPVAKIESAGPKSTPIRKTDQSSDEAHVEHQEHKEHRDGAFLEEDDDHSPPPVNLTEAQSDREVLVGTEVIQKLIGYLGVTATVSARRVEAVDGKDTRHWVLEISGEELALLIGSKGETLGALQYLTRLIAAKTLGHRVNLVVDVAGYKSHREDMLRRLAKRMATQVIQTNRSVSLEPMPPHERRIIHLALRDHPSVKTESVGEGEKRKVTIVPRRN